MRFRNKHLRHPFEKRILDVKRQVRPEPWDWYQFDSFSNLTHIESLLPGGLGRLVELAADEPLADFGTGDGDLAFLFEHLGFHVTAADWPGSNANSMRGIELMKRELKSSIAIREVDVDDRFRLDGERFGLVLALGILYHLKNPFYFLERLAQHARYCLLSTAILPRGTRDAIAYLSRDREYNDDTTNFWFFSEAGMARLLDRCGWNILHRNITGDDKDARFVCFAESRIAKEKPTLRLLDGWHAIENDAWRWTGREFGAILESPSGAARLELRFTILPELLAHSNPVMIEASIDGVSLGLEKYGTPGEGLYERALPKPARRAEVRVRLSHTLRVGERELGLVVRVPAGTIAEDDCGLRML